MYKTIQEGKAKLLVPKEEKVSADLPVFYNPIMKQNRDISIEFLRALGHKEMQICDLLAGTGARAIRFLQELPEEMIKNITINDADKEAVKIINKNLELNRSAEGNGLNRLNVLNEIKKNNDELGERTYGLGDKTCEEAGHIIFVTNLEASKLLLESSGYDYIDIDPFGTPNPFLDASCKRISRKGILAVTATDTSALSGTFPKACKRKYWAKPRRDYLMHETGLRILIRKVQLVAAQYDKALIPRVSYSKDHYMRIFFECRKGKSKVDEVLKQHGNFNDCGPMWLGNLWDEKLLAKMSHDDLTEILHEESKIEGIGFFDLHNMCKKLGKEVPKFSKVFELLKEKGFKVSRTHFTKYGIRSDAKYEDVEKILKKKIY